MAVQTVVPGRGVRSGAAVVVLSVPTDHAYVRHLAPLPGELHDTAPVVRLPDATDPWWPPRALDPAWLAARTGDFDLLHLHFGFDGATAAGLRDMVDVLRAAGRPLVLTVHDLRNPHHRERGTHDEHLDVLVPAADALVTLTPGAADEIARRWGRQALVLPHPHVVDLGVLRRRRARPASTSPTVTVAVHLKSMRAAVCGAPVVDALVDAVAALPDTVLRVDVHPEVEDASGPDHHPDVVAALGRARAAGARVEVHERFDDDALWDYLADVDVSVLPYAYGTHSGWLEACRDLGTAVVAPRHGYYAEQGPVHGFDLDESSLDATSLVTAVRAARAALPVAPVDVADRVGQRRALAAAHADLYAQVLAAQPAAGRRR